MTRYVCLLRAVNVGGRAVPMAELRALFESLGYSEVASYIQSGNVVFGSSKSVRGDALEASIEAAFGVKTSPVLRTAAEMAEVAAAHPFRDADPTKLHVGFLAARPPKAAVSALEPEGFLPERFAVSGRELYLHLPAGMARTKLPGYLERRLKLPVTFRNWRTVQTLAEMAGTPLRRGRPPRS